MHYSFPPQKSSPLKVMWQLIPYLRRCWQRDTAHDFGSLNFPSFQLSKLVGQLFENWNINHLGNWSSSSDKPWNTRELEREVIGMMADLYEASLSTVGGYVTTGGSESNMFLALMGREKLRSLGVESIALLCTSLTHYSVTKSARILDVPLIKVPLDDTSWSMSISGFSEVVKKSYQQGRRGFLVPLTLGYSATGTSDDLNSMMEEIRQLQIRYTDARFFVWVDAALNGLIEPFATNPSLSFSQSQLEGVVVDFHKFGGVSPTASVVLYRQELRKLIESDIEYLSLTDATLLGGRSGVPAIQAWSVIRRLGKKGFQRRVAQVFQLKEKLTDLLDEHGLSYVTDSKSITLAVLVTGDNRLPPALEEKYNLHFSKINIHFRKAGKKTQSLYKVFVGPHLTEGVINKFVNELASARI